MNTKSQLLQYPPFCFDYLIFGVYVVLIKYQWAWSPVSPPIPVTYAQSTGFSLGIFDTSLTVAMTTASSLCTTPHHPGFGKCSWSLFALNCRK